MIVYTPFTDEDLESQRGQEWPKQGDQEKARTRSPDQDSFAQAPSQCIVGVWLSLCLASLLRFYPPGPPTTKQPRTDTPDSQVSLIPAAADQPCWLKSPGTTAILNMERRAGCSGSILLAMAQVSFKDMINYGTPRPEAEHHNSAKIIAQEGKDGVSKILIQSFVLIFKILFCDYFLLITVSWSQTPRGHGSMFMILTLILHRGVFPVS